MRDPSRKRALAAYRALSHGYDASSGRIHGIRRAAVDSLGLREGDVAFDVACGTGDTLVEIARRVGSSGRAIGIEQSADMAAQAREKVAASGFADRVTLLVTPVEEARLPARADALLFCYTHDVLQTPAAIDNLFRHAKPGARVAMAGVRLLPWWWGWPVNAVTLWRTRAYLTTFRGLRKPWAPVEARCREFGLEAHYHFGMSYRARGIVEGD